MNFSVRLANMVNFVLSWTYFAVRFNDYLIAGIGIEGIGCMLAGAFGSGSGTTSYSENIGAIGITKVTSVSCQHAYHSHWKIIAVSWTNDLHS